MPATTKEVQEPAGVADEMSQDTASVSRRYRATATRQINPQSLVQGIAIWRNSERSPDLLCGSPRVLC
jgi:hypothetical protein